MGLITKEKANSKAIFDHLFDQMHKLNAKVITVDEAKAQANLAKQANNVLRQKLDESIAKARYGSKFKYDESKFLT